MEIQTDAKQGAGLESLPPACQARKPSPSSQEGQVNNQGEVWRIKTESCDSELPWKSPEAAPLSPLYRSVYRGSILLPHGQDCSQGPGSLRLNVAPSFPK